MPLPPLRPGAQEKIKQSRDRLFERQEPFDSSSFRDFFPGGDEDDDGEDDAGEDDEDDEDEDDDEDGGNNPQ